MTALDAILDGFESALELERELGNRIVPCDRKLLAPLAEASSAPPPAKPRATNREPRTTNSEPRIANHESRDLLFIHHCPFTERGQELMDNIIKIRDTFQIAIMLIEHDMKLVSGICEELTVLNFGQVLAQGKTSDVLNDPQVIKAYLGE